MWSGLGAVTLFSKFQMLGCKLIGRLARRSWPLVVTSLPTIRGEARPSTDADRSVLTGIEGLDLATGGLRCDELTLVAGPFRAFPFGAWQLTLGIVEGVHSAFGGRAACCSFLGHDVSGVVEAIREASDEGLLGVCVIMDFERLLARRRGQSGHALVQRLGGLAQEVRAPIVAIADVENPVELTGEMDRVVLLRQGADGRVAACRPHEDRGFPLGRMRHDDDPFWEHRS